jgi:tetratricopeptide (TPR) repeat protein
MPVRVDRLGHRLGHISALVLFSLLILTGAEATGNDESLKSAKNTIEKMTANLKKNPNDADALIQRGRAEVMMERFKEGLADLDKGLRLDPSRANAYVFDWRRQALCDAGRWKPAIEDASRSITLEPKVGWRYKERAQLYMALYQRDLALKDYTTATRLSPKDFWCFLDRGNFYASVHKYDEALADYSAAIRLADGHPKPYQCRAELYEKLGRLDLARKDREMAGKNTGF